jgi:release factor glutamine methyltransferase
MGRAEAGSIGAALQRAAERLRASGSPTPRLDAEVLLAHHTGMDRSGLLAHPEQPLDDVAAFEALVDRRGAGEPVAYIRGFKEWHSLRIRTDPRALIPRPETELLADAAVDEITRRLSAQEDHVIGWDVATGSGAVAVVLAAALREHVEHGHVRLLATDVSPAAIELAAENLQAHAVADLVTLECSDMLELAGDALPRPDVVVANLPYVASAEVDERRGSLGFEPRIAVDGGPDGLVLLRRLFDELPARTAPGATVLLEIGVDQADAVARLAPDGASVAIVPDLAGLDRVVRIQMPD